MYKELIKADNKITKTPVLKLVRVRNRQKCE